MTKAIYAILAVTATILLSSCTKDTLEVSFSDDEIIGRDLSAGAEAALFEAQTEAGTCTLACEAATYRDNGTLAVRLWKVEDGQATEPLKVITANVGEDAGEAAAYIDVDATPWAEGFIRENGLGENTGRARVKGTHLYLLYKFHLEKFNI